MKILHLDKWREKDQRRRRIQYKAWLAAEGVAGSVKENLFGSQVDLTPEEREIWADKFLSDLKHELKVVLSI
jgi:hypothetical protein